MSRDERLAQKQIHQPAGRSGRKVRASGGRPVCPERRSAHERVAADASQMRADDAAHFTALQGDLTSWHDDERLRRRLVGAHELECKCSKDNCLTSARLGLRDHVDAHAAYWDRTCLDGRWPLESCISEATKDRVGQSHLREQYCFLS